MAVRTVGEPMNASTFATSPYARSLVLTAVAFFAAAIVVAIWTMGEWEKARRLTLLRDLRRQRAERPRLRLVAGHASGPATPERSVAGRAQYARSVGIDELQVEDFSLWAERIR